MGSRSDPISCLNPSLIKELEHDAEKRVPLFGIML